MKLLLTSGGVTNTSIREALVDLLGKPLSETIWVGLSAESMVMTPEVDETAIRVVDGTVEVVSEGHWALLSS